MTAANRYRGATKVTIVSGDATPAREAEAAPDTGGGSQDGAGTHSDVSDNTATQASDPGQPGRATETPGSDEAERDAESQRTTASGASTDRSWEPGARGEDSDWLQQPITVSPESATAESATAAPAWSLYTTTAALPARAEARASSKAQRSDSTGHRTFRTLATVAAACLLGTAGGYIAGTQGQEPQQSVSESIRVDNTAASVPVAANWVTEVSAQLQPSVVSVIASRNGQPFSTGSGVVLTSDGYIMTNAHVVAGATDVSVRLSDATTLPGTVKGADTVYDIAVIKVDKDLPAATFNTASVVVGEPVAAFGAPLGLYGTVTVGIVSAVARPVTAGDGSGETSIISAVQTDAAVNPGNSGGPLVNTNGQVVGINSSIATLSGGPGGGSIGLGFAIPAATAVRVAEEIADTGSATRPLIGVSIGPASPFGARIDAVTPGGPAEAAGILVGDVLTAVDGTAAESPVAAIALIRNARPGQSIRLTVLRDGQTRDIDVLSVAETGPLRTPSPAPPSTPPTQSPSPAPSGPQTSTPAPSAPAPSAS